MKKNLKSIFFKPWILKSGIAISILLLALAVPGLLNSEKSPLYPLFFQYQKYVNQDLTISFSKFSNEIENYEYDTEQEIPEIEGAENLSASELHELEMRIRSGSDLRNAMESFKTTTMDILNYPKLQAIENTQNASIGLTSFSFLTLSFFLFLLFKKKS